MKVGMVFECGPQGADKAVWTHLAAALRSGIEISAVTPRLARLAGAVGFV